MCSTRSVISEYLLSGEVFTLEGEGMLGLLYEQKHVHAPYVLLEAMDDPCFMVSLAFARGRVISIVFPDGTPKRLGSGLGSISG